MVEEKIKSISVIGADEKEFKNILKEWIDKARSECRPVCVTCARLDRKNNKLKDYKHYTSGYTKVSESISYKKEFNKKEMGSRYIIIDYKCPRDHGFTLQYRKEEYDNLQNKGKEKKGK